MNGATKLISSLAVLKYRQVKKGKQLLLEMVLYTLDNNYFTYEGRYYKQIFCCAMGSKLSPILGQYVMDYHLDTCIPRIFFNLIFIKKVNDLVLLLPEENISSYSS